MQTLYVELGERRYPIYIGAGVLDRVADLLAAHMGREVMVVSNSTIAPLYLHALLQSLRQAGHVVDSIVLPDGEACKDLEHLNRVFDALLQAGHSRKTTLLALGGGVVGDMTGFAAACYQRGANFVQVPTTLLAQVDSSVGGKTGVNHALGKNMIGAFMQPSCVLIDTLVLSTLPDRELCAGLAEVIKYGLIRDPAFYQWLQQNMPRLLARDPEALAYAIKRSCQNKAEVVAADEHEQHDVRALLNLGHTFGHAIEAMMGYGNWLHGEAVAVGMLMAAELSCRQGWIDVCDVRALRALLLAANLPVLPPVCAVDEWLGHMALDKKNLDRQLHLVLLRAIGQAEVVRITDQQLLREVLQCACPGGQQGDA